MEHVDQGLIIVNNRRHARELFDKLRASDITGTRHLTTAMTAAHRQQVLADIRLDLSANLPVRLVSTSLIEAGIDISFKAVWRAWAGLVASRSTGRPQVDRDLIQLGRQFEWRLIIGIVHARAGIRSDVEGIAYLKSNRG